MIDGRCWSLGIWDTEDVRKPLFLIRGADWPDAYSLFTGEARLPPRSIALHLGLTEPLLHPGAEWVSIQVALVTGLDGVGLDLRTVKPQAQGRGLTQHHNFWTLMFDGQEVQIPHLVGLTQLSHVVENPNREFTALELSALSNRVSIAATASVESHDLGTGGLGEDVIDDTYRDELRTRLTSLDTKKSASGLSPDQESERVQIHNLLRTSAGLGGRPRRASNEAERARLAVTNAIRRALEHINNHLPEMADYLRPRIVLGSRIIYRDSTSDRWSVTRLSTPIRRA